MAVSIDVQAVLEKDPDRWPLLYASKHSPAHNPVIEWRLGDGLQHNYCQIIRTKSDDVAAHLDEIEKILLHGVRDDGSSYQPPYRTCGGVKFLLGRKPKFGDRLTVKWLRRPHLGSFDGHDGLRQWEILSEVSLQVQPKKGS